MATYEFATVDVFTDVRFGGNPLAVIPDARGLSDEQMQAIAREFNLSETTFVLPPADPSNTACVRIFTPAGELPFAGHPNVGTAFVLARRKKMGGGTLRFEEKAGLVVIELEPGEQGSVRGARVNAPCALSIGRLIDPESVAACSGLATSDIEGALRPPLFADVGTAFAFARVNTHAALRRARPDLSAFRQALARYPDKGGRFQLHLYFRDADSSTVVHTRMFAPLFGIIEDPATGSANAALAALFTQWECGPGEEKTFDIRQGDEMGRPSRILAKAWKLADGSVHSSVAGPCAPVSTGTIEA